MIYANTATQCSSFKPSLSISRRSVVKEIWCLFVLRRRESAAGNGDGDDAFCRIIYFYAAKPRLGGTYER